MGGYFVTQTSHTAPRTSTQQWPRLNVAHRRYETVYSLPMDANISKYLLAMIEDVEKTYKLGKYNQQPSSHAVYYTKIKKRLSFDAIKANIRSCQYYTVGSAFKDINSIWSGVYGDYTEYNNLDPTFKAFADNLEDEWVESCKKFEKLLQKNGYIKELSEDYYEIKVNDKYNNNNHQMQLYNNNNNNQRMIQLNNNNVAIKIEKDTTPITPLSKQENNSNNSNNNNNCDLRSWFELTVKLPQYYDVFVSNGFEDLTFIMGIIRGDDLKSMGITKLGHRRKILHFAKSPDSKRSRRSFDGYIENDNNGYLNTEPPSKRRKLMD